MEINKGIFNAAADIYENNRGSILRTVVYTIGHFIIAITVLMIVADVSFVIALTDAIVEPLANSVWYFILDRMWIKKAKIIEIKYCSSFCNRSQSPKSFDKSISSARQKQSICFLYICHIDWS